MSVDIEIYLAVQGGIFRKNDCPLVYVEIMFDGSPFNLRICYVARFGKIQQSTVPDRMYLHYDNVSANNSKLLGLGLSERFK